MRTIVRNGLQAIALVTVCGVVRRCGAKEANTPSNRCHAGAVCSEAADRVATLLVS